MVCPIVYVHARSPVVHEGAGAREVEQPGASIVLIVGVCLPKLGGLVS